jgi:hypothetical protein
MYGLELMVLHVVGSILKIFSSFQSLQIQKIFQEEFEDTNGVIRIHKSKKKRHHNGQKKCIAQIQIDILRYR